MPQNFTGNPAFRQKQAQAIRQHAAELAFDREHSPHRNNGDESLSGVPMSFTKGLSHDPATLLVENPDHFKLFRLAIAHGVVDYFTVAVPPNGLNGGDHRQWEAPTAGHVFSLEGPDPQAVTMPPAPKLGSAQLTYEMAEVYELALLRDVPFALFSETPPAGADAAQSARVADTLTRLNALAYATGGYSDETDPTTGHVTEARPRKRGGCGTVAAGTMFRGSAPGVETGPYLSQFLLMGTGTVGGLESATDGYVGYGAQRIDQRVPQAVHEDDYMMDEASYLAIQNGADVPGDQKQSFVPGARRFITTPRDMATYVHFDALYQAYLNACLILLGQGAPFDKGFDHLSGMGSYAASGTGGFALWGGPHVLTLVTEVATRALKAVRFQKFNNHRRLRPEALAARLQKATEIAAATGITAFEDMRDALDTAPGGTPSLLAEIRAHNQNLAGADTVLLPMAFKEGSPMHPAYGAGHATVAGACVTVLKAFFDTDAELVEYRPLGQPGATPQIGFQRPDAVDVLRHVQFVPPPDGIGDLSVEDAPAPLTLEGELNKLAANISIGRNMAGVHYFTDYYDSLRMGEKVALGILGEQALCYTKDLFEMTVHPFDEAAALHSVSSGGVSPFFS